MDRLIEVKVKGNFVRKDNKNAGTQGEYNITTMRIQFDEGWDGYAKHLTFWDAYGENPVKRILTADLLEDITASTRIYCVKIPGEPLAHAGEMSFVIDGYIDGVLQRTVEDHLTVKPANSAEDAGDPADPTPSQAQQLQAQIDTLLADMQTEAVRAEDAANDAVAAATNARQHEEASKDYEQECSQHVDDAAAHVGAAAASAATAGAAAVRAETALRRTPIIGDNGNWYVYNSSKGVYEDTGYAARGETGPSGVYVGSGEMPEDCNVQIDPNGAAEPINLYPKIGDNGDWYVYSPTASDWEDTGVAAQGVGIDYIERGETITYGSIVNGVWVEGAPQTEYTIHFTDGSTFKYIVTDGKKGKDGKDGKDNTFFVTIDSAAMTANKTNAEIYAAYMAGMSVHVVDAAAGLSLPLVTCDAAYAEFCGLIAGGTRQATVTIINDELGVMGGAIGGETPDEEYVQMLIEADMLPAVYNADGKILTDSSGNVVLRY